MYGHRLLFTGAHIWVYKALQLFLEIYREPVKKN